MTSVPRAAAFLDRDGTIIEYAEYVGSTSQVTLMRDAGSTIRKLNEMRIPVVVVTNQSGIARGYFTVEDYERVHRYIDDLLAAEAARVDATYYCPHHPDFTGPCRCRKPDIAMFEWATRDLGLDPSRSLFAGDRWRDAAPALAFGGRGILIPVTETPPEDVANARDKAEIVSTLTEAVDRWLVSLQASGG